MATFSLSPGRVVRAAIAVVIALALVGLWMVAQTAFVRFALDRAVAQSDGRLSVEGVEGTLFEGVWIRALVWNDPAPDGVRARIDELRLRWRPLALLERELDLSLLAARSLTVRTRASDQPVTLPQSLQLPFALRLREVKIASLRIEPEGAQPVELEGVELAARYGDGAYRVERLRVDSRWGEAQLFGAIGDTAPFAISAGLMGEARWSDAPGSRASGEPASAATRSLTFAASIDGTPTLLRVSAAATPPGRGASPGLVSARFELRPLEAQPLGPVELGFDDFDPAGLGLAQAVAMRLSGAAEVLLRLPEGDSGFGASGRVDARNALAGSAARNGVPVRSARADFRWSNGRLELERLRAALVGEGSVAGRASVDTKQSVAILGNAVPMIALDFAVDGVDLAAVAGAPQPTRLNGRIALKGSGFDVDLSDGVRGGAQLAAAGEVRDGRLELARALLRSLPGLGAASLEAAGSVALAAPYAARLSGRFGGLDPSRIESAVAALAPEWASGLAGASDALAALPGAIDGAWSVEGALAGATTPLRIALEGVSGRLAGHPARADVQATILPLRVDEVRASVALGQTRVDARGALGSAGDRMTLALRAPRLAELAGLLRQPGLEGSIVADAQLRGPFDAPAIDLEATGKALTVPGVGSVASAELSARIPALTDPARARLQAKGSLAGLRVGSESVRNLRFEVEGTADAHSVAASLDSERGALRLAGEGALRFDRAAAAGARWRATLGELSARSGKVDARLAAPVTIDASRDAVEIGATVVESAYGRIRVGRASWRDGRFALAADASVPSLGPPARAFGIEPPEAGLDAGLDDVSLDVSVDLSGTGVDDLSGTATAKLASPPSVGASGEARLELRESRVSGTLRADLPSFAFARRLVGPEWLFDGRLSFAGGVTGTVRSPRLAGDLRGEALRLEQRALGWRLGDGTLAGRFDGERFRLESLKLASRARGGGSVELRGEVSASTLDGRFDFVADRLVVPFGPGQRVVLSGDASATSAGGKFEIRGRLRADEGRIEIGGGEAPALPADVVIVGADRGAAADSAPDAAARLRIGADVSLDLGRNLRVSGKGIDARLTGALTLRGSLPDTPRAYGTVRVVDGRYSAYGQQLSITRGRVVFNGALDNPVLDIVALRREQPVEAGVALTGTVLSPQIRLTSEPDVPDAEKLSWLVLGVPLENAQSGAQGAALKAAAATLFARNDGGLSGGLADTLGLDVLTVRSASPGASDFAPAGFGASSTIPGQIGSGGGAAGVGAAENVVAVGKRLGSRVLVTYEQGLRGAWNLLKIQYDITRRLSLRAQTGTDSALDLLYRYPFD